jgi:hypothetical protein
MCQMTRYGKSMAWEEVRRSGGQNVRMRKNAADKMSDQLASGSHTLNVLPAPIRLSTEISPRWRLINV